MDGRYERRERRSGGVVSAKKHVRRLSGGDYVADHTISILYDIVRYCTLLYGYSQSQ